MRRSREYYLAVLSNALREASSDSTMAWKVGHIFHNLPGALALPWTEERENRVRSGIESAAKALEMEGSLTSWSDPRSFNDQTSTVLILSRKSKRTEFSRATFLIAVGYGLVEMRALGLAEGRPDRSSLIAGIIGEITSELLSLKSWKGATGRRLYERIASAAAQKDLEVAFKGWFQLAQRRLSDENRGRSISSEK